MIKIAIFSHFKTDFSKIKVTKGNSIMKSKKNCPIVIPTPSLCLCMLTCINICSHVTSYMIIAKHTQIG